MSSDRWMPEKVANIEAIISGQRLEQTSKVTKMEKFNIDKPATQSAAGLSCEAYLQ